MRKLEWIDWIFMALSIACVAALMVTASYL